MAIDVQLPTFPLLSTTSLFQLVPFHEMSSRSYELWFRYEIRGRSLLSRAIELYIPLSLESSTVSVWSTHAVPL